MNSRGATPPPSGTFFVDLAFAAGAFFVDLALVATFFAVFINRNWRYAVFLVLQGITFAAFGLSCGVDGHRRTCC